MSSSRSRRLRTGAFAVLAAGALVATGLAPAQAGPADRGADEFADYIVVLGDDAAPRRASRRHADRFDLTVGHVYTSALRGYSARIPERAVRALEAAPGVRSVELDRPVRTTAQSTPTGIARTLATQSPTASIDGVDDRVDVDVAVIDTGVDLDHPDLNVHRAGAKACGLLNFSADDQQGHGTHVAGTIGALDNSTGVVGVAPGARIWPVRVLNALGSGSTSDVICGIDHVAANADEIEVANMSLGGSGRDYGSCGGGRDAMHQAICAAVDAGVTFVVAAGNESSDAATSTPAAYDEVITVSALADFDGRPGGLGRSTCRADVDDTFANFSNFGADVDLIAPGVCTESTWLRGGYNTISGTSMASPHVAGGAALYLARNPGARPTQVRSALVAAGSGDWNAVDDPDGIKEPLLDVSAF